MDQTTPRTANAGRDPLPRSIVFLTSEYLSPWWEGRVAMWRRFLERFVPLVDDGPSVLDRLDGVGGPLVTAMLEATADSRPSQAPSAAVSGADGRPDQPRKR